METLPDLTSEELSSTDASHSGIGRATAIDYNLASIHKNAVIVVDRTVAVRVAVVTPDQAVIPG